jgi:ribosomal protein S18 acetylase RimI-like enzyme
MFIRKMKLEDAEQISRVTREIMLDNWDRYEKDYYPRRAFEFDISRHSAEKYRESLMDKTSFTLVAEEKGKIVGVATGALFGDSGLARLNWIGVYPNQQKKGIGKTLLMEVVNYCITKGCHKITLYTMPNLIPAMNLYLRFGFVPEAYLHKEWWAVDFLKMSKWL